MNRMGALVACMFVACLTQGQLYAFAVYGGALKQTLSLTQDDLDTIGTFPYISGFFVWIPGRLNDRYGPRAAIRCGGAGMALGTVAYWAVARQLTPAALDPVWSLVVVGFLTQLVHGAITYFALNGRFSGHFSNQKQVHFWVILAEKSVYLLWNRQRGYLLVARAELSAGARGGGRDRQGMDWAELGDPDAALHRAGWLPGERAGDTGLPAADGGRVPAGGGRPGESGGALPAAPHARARPKAALRRLHRHCAAHRAACDGGRPRRCRFLPGRAERVRGGDLWGHLGPGVCEFSCMDEDSSIDKNESRSFIY